MQLRALFHRITRLESLLILLRGSKCRIMKDVCTAKQWCPFVGCIPLQLRDVLVDYEFLEIFGQHDFDQLSLKIQVSVKPEKSGTTVFPRKFRELYKSQGKFFLQQQILEKYLNFVKLLFFDFKRLDSNRRDMSFLPTIRGQIIREK